MALPPDVATALAVFDNAAQEHGWHSDQGSRRSSLAAHGEWLRAREALELAILSAIAAPAIHEAAAES